MRHEHLKKTLRKLKQLDFRRASASFWLGVKRPTARAPTLPPGALDKARAKRIQRFGSTSWRLKSAGPHR